MDDDSGNQGTAASGGLAIGMLAVGGAAISRFPLTVLAYVLAGLILAMASYLIRAWLTSRSIEQQRVRARALLALSPPPRISTVAPAALGLETLDEDTAADPVEASLTSALAANARVLVLIGARSGGRSRSMLLTLRRESSTVRERLLLVPADGAALRDLLSTPADLARPGERYVLWLADLERFLGGVRLHDLDRLILSDVVTVVATLDTAAARRVLAVGQDRAHVLRGVLARAHRVVAPEATVSTTDPLWLTAGQPLYHPIPYPTWRAAHRLNPRRWAAEVYELWRRTSWPMIATALGVAAGAVLVFMALTPYGQVATQPALADRYHDLRAEGNDCGGVGVSPADSEAVEHDVVVLHHYGDFCPGSDSIDMYAIGHDTVGRRPTSTFVIASDHQQSLRCLGPDAHDPCHADIKSNYHATVVGLHDVTTDTWIPIAIYAKRPEGFVVAPLKLYGRPEAFEPDTAAVRIYDDRHKDRPHLALDQSASVVTLDRPRINRAAVLLAGYRSVPYGPWTLRANVLGRTGPEKHLKAVQVCHPIGLYETFAVATAQNPIAAVRQAWLRAIRNDAAGCVKHK